jgi:hypothetical protein
LRRQPKVSDVSRAVGAAAFFLAASCVAGSTLGCGSVRAGTPTASLQIVDFDHLMIGCTSSRIAERIYWRTVDSNGARGVAAAKTMAVELVEDSNPGPEHVYWIAYGIAPNAPWFFPGSAPHEGRNSDGAVGYEAPCPSTAGEWFKWKVFALDAMPALKDGFSVAAFEGALSGHVLAEGSLRTHYERAPP